MTDFHARMIGLKNIAGIPRSIRSMLEKFADEAYIIGSVVGGETDLDPIVTSPRNLDRYSLLERAISSA